MAEGTAVGMAVRDQTGSSAPGSVVHLREASLSDYAQVAALQSRNGLATRSAPEWQGLWKDNPALLRATQRLPIGWVIEAEHGNIVGFLGNLPLAYRFQGRDLTAATAYSWVVDPAYRGYSVQLLTTFRKQPSVDLFIFATVNSAAEAVLRAFGLRKIPAGQWDTARFWITDHRGFVASALIARSMGFLSSLTPLLAAPLWVKDAVHGALSTGSLVAASGLEIRVESDFDVRFQHFWSEIERNNRTRLLAVRDLETLTWHYRSTSRKGSLWIVTASLNGRLVAYWTVDRQDHPSLGLKRLRFVDFQALPGYQSLLRTAVDWTLAQCRMDNIHVAEDLGSWLQCYGIPGTVGPYKRRMKSWLFYYAARSPELMEQLKNPAVWMPSSFDGDASL